MHNKYIITYECHDNAPRMLSLTSLLSAPEREVTSPSDFKVVGALMGQHFKVLLISGLSLYPLYIYADLKKHLHVYT